MVGDVSEVLFVFKGEGGIRDGLVAGVQACALPILSYKPLRGFGLAGRVVGAVSLERQNPGGAYSLGPSMLCPQPASDFRRQVRPSVWRSDLAARARNAANPQIRHNAASNRCDLSSAQARRKLDMLAQHARPPLPVHSMESRKLE